MQIGIKVEKILGKKALLIPSDEIMRKVEETKNSIPKWTWNTIIEEAHKRG